MTDKSNSKMLSIICDDNVMNEQLIRFGTELLGRCRELSLEKRQELIADIRQIFEAKAASKESRAVLDKLEKFLLG